MKHVDFCFYFIFSLCFIVCVMDSFMFLEFKYKTVCLMSSVEQEVSPERQVSVHWLVGPVHAGRLSTLIFVL